MKLAHLPEGHREALIVAGYLEGFDIGVAAQPPIWSSMPATLIPSPGTEVRVAVLYLTPLQFTALWWTELSYKLGALDRIGLTTDVTDEPITRVIAFISRYGAYCVDGVPVAMAAIPARKRTVPAMTQLEILDSAAGMLFGEGATARDLIRSAYENPAVFASERMASFRAVSVPFTSERWTEMPIPAPSPS